jgi:hypothetical protein
LPLISIMWIMPGSLVVGVVCGSVASLLPIGLPSKLSGPRGSVNRRD